MSKEEAILVLEVLIDCYKEDGTSYNAKKEWEALEVFKRTIEQLDIANKKLEDIENLVKTKMYVFSFNQMMILANEDDYKEVLSIIGGE